MTVELFNNVSYSSSSTTTPFTVSLNANAVAAPNDKVGYFFIRQDSNPAIYAEVEGTVSGGNTLTVNFVHQSSAVNVDTLSGYALPTFTGGVTIFSAYPSTVESLPKSPGRDGILIIGQSNAVGYNGPGVQSGLSGYSPLWHQPDPNIYQLCKSSTFVDPQDTTWQTANRATKTDADIVDKFVVATEPLQHVQHSSSGGPASSAGFGLEFAKIYRRKTPGARQVVLLPGARGATSFTSAGTGNVWNAPSGGLYTNALSLINQFLAENSDNRLVAILWHQGESNSTTTPSEYEGYLDAMIQALRDNAVGNTRQPSIAGVPFVIGGLSKNWIANGGSNRQDIDNSLEDTPNRVSYCGYADPAADFETGTGIDDVHFGAIAHLRFAELYYQAWHDAKGSYIPAVVAAPATPTGLSLSAGDGQISANWNATSGATGYVIEYKLTTDGSYTALAEQATTGGIITGLTNGSAYDVRVFARNSGGDSSPTAAQQETPTAAPTVAPAPGSLNAVAGDGQASLTWGAVVHDPVVTGYNIQYRIAGSSDSYANQAVSGQATVAATVSGLTNGTNYEFRIASVNSVGTGNYSGLVTAQPEAPTTAAAPTGLAATPGDSQVAFVWNTVTHDPVVTGYSIRYRAQGSSDAYTTVAISGQDTAAHTITGLTNDAALEFSIASVNSVGTGSYSANVNSTPTAGSSDHPNTDALAPVTHLRRGVGIVETTDAGRVEQWTDQSGNGNHFTQTTLTNKPSVASSDITFSDVGGTAGQWLTNASAALDLTTFANGFTIIVRYHNMADVFANRTIMQTHNDGPELRVDGFGKFQYSPIDSTSTGATVQDTSGGEGELGTQIRAITHSTGGTPTMRLLKLNDGTAAQEESQAYAYPTVHTEIRIGTSMEASNLDGMDCIMRDFLIFDKVLTDTEIENVVAEFETVA